MIITVIIADICASAVFIVHDYMYDYYSDYLLTYVPPQWLVANKEVLADTQIAFGIRLQVCTCTILFMWTRMHVRALTHKQTHTCTRVYLG